jgi:hypothetical protein
MMGPDDNAPTVPNSAIPPAGAPPGSASPPGAAPMPPAPAFIDDRGKAPVWQTAKTPVAQPAGPMLGNVGLGFAVALFVLAVMAIGLIIALNVRGNNGAALGEVPTPTVTATATQNPQTPTATPLPPAPSLNKAKTLVANFYGFITQQQFQGAYNLLGSQYQSQTSLQQFQQQWQNVQSIQVDQTSLTAQPDGGDSTKVDVSISYAQTNTDNSQTLVQALLLVGYDQNNLRILSISTNSTPATATPQPTQTPQPTDTPGPTPTPVATDTPQASPTATATVSGMPVTPTSGP